MRFTKKIDRAFQWAGEKMGGEARTTHTEEFKALEAEMTLRHEGVESLQKSMNIYSRWVNRRCDALEDRNRNTPVTVLGNAMAAHGEDFEPDSEFGNLLVTVGQANQRIAELQAGYLEAANVAWTQQLERNLAMMKEYQAARKKLENRRLAHDATMAKMQKAKQDDFRLEDELRANRDKFEESSEDVLRHMQDIKDAEVDSIAGLTSFLDAELDYYDRAAAELRRVRDTMTGAAAGIPSTGEERIGGRSRSNTGRSWQAPRQSVVYEEPRAIAAPAPRKRIPSAASYDDDAPPAQPPRPPVSRARTLESRSVSGASRGVPTALSRTVTDSAVYGGRSEDVFADDSSVDSGGRSPDLSYRSASPATSYSSVGRSTISTTVKKPPPPPPPVNRAKKPPPPPVPRKTNFSY